jgi:hypothetical protein
MRATNCFIYINNLSGAEAKILNDSLEFERESMWERLRCAQYYFEKKKEKLMLVKQYDSQRELRQQIVLK